MKMLAYLLAIVCVIVAVNHAAQNRSIDPEAAHANIHPSITPFEPLPPLHTPHAPMWRVFLTGIDGTED